jgi:peptidoglycan-associated lipoprotein
MKPMPLVLKNLTELDATINRIHSRNGLPFRGACFAPVATLDQGRTEMNSKILGVLAGVALLAACADKTGASSGSGATAATSGPAPGSQEDLVANVGDRVFFDFDRSTLKPDARATLDRQSGWLSRYPQVNVQLAGNCDDRGTEEYNLALGQRRANSSRDYLVARGVAGSRISTISYGKDRPTALGDNEQSWAQNRNTITSVR